MSKNFLKIVLAFLFKSQVDFYIWYEIRLTFSCKFKKIVCLAYNSIPAPKAQGSLWKRRQKICKSQKNRDFAVKFPLL